MRNPSMLFQSYCDDMSLRHCAPQLVFNASPMLAVSMSWNVWLTLPPSKTRLLSSGSTKGMAAHGKAAVI